VIICTQNRVESLRITLECLAFANRNAIRAEVIVVDNASSDNTKNVVESFQHRIPIRYLYESTQGVYGKSHALNRALEAGGLGDIIAVLDDDMSPQADWFQGVAAICDRWPDKDIFTSHTYVIWPSEDVPDWARSPRIQSWIFSAASLTGSDAELEDGRWFSGNHFWFRSRVLKGGRRFRDMWLTEPDFQLDLVEEGFRGVAGRGAIAGHRIQPELLQRDIVLNRAKKTGALYAWLRLQPYRSKVKQARLLHGHPWLGRLFCLLVYLRWRMTYFISYLYLSDASRFEHKLVAIERMTTYLELLRAANRLGDYSGSNRFRGPQRLDESGTLSVREQSPPSSNIDEQ
jgi:glycosyltransferase involved in cell wall biosynthesis